MKESVYMTITTVIILFSVGIMFEMQHQQIENLKYQLNTHDIKLDEYNSFLGADWETWQNIENNIINNSQYNFQAMRDLFTPMYNDTVTVTPAGYRMTEYNWTTNEVVSPGGWMFWVNHTQELWSYYFEDAYNYLVLFNDDTDRIEVINSSNCRSKED